MSATFEIRQAQVLALSQEDRSRLLERLVASLDMDAGVEHEWETVRQSATRSWSRAPSSATRCTACQAAMSMW